MLQASLIFLNVASFSFDDSLHKKHLIRLLSEHVTHVKCPQLRN